MAVSLRLVPPEVQDGTDQWNFPVKFGRAWCVQPSLSNLPVLRRAGNASGWSPPGHRQCDQPLQCWHGAPAPGQTGNDSAVCVQPLPAKVHSQKRIRRTSAESVTKGNPICSAIATHKLSLAVRFGAQLVVEMCHGDFKGGDLPCQVEQAQAVRSSGDTEYGCSLHLEDDRRYMSLVHHPSGNSIT